MALRIMATALLSLILALLWPDPGRLTAASSVDSPLSERHTSPVSACKMLQKPGVKMSNGFPRPGQSLFFPPTGALTVFMVFVDFKDARMAGKSSPQRYYDTLVAPALKFLEQVSYGNFSVDMHVDLSRFHSLPGDAPSYHLREPSVQDIHNLAEAALRAYEADTDDEFPSAEAMYIVLPEDAPETETSIMVPYPLKIDGYIVAGSVIVIGSRAWLYGKDAYKVLAHETLHFLGLPDYYRIPLPSERTAGKWRPTEYVGGWNIMSSDAFGPSPDLLAWDKWRLGWLTDDQIICVSRKGFDWLTLTPLYMRGGGAKAVVLRLSESYVLVAEYRARGGVDAATCSPGLLVYVVSNAVDRGQGQVRVIDANPKTVGCLGDALDDATLHPTGTWSLTIRDFLFEKPGFKVSFQLTDNRLREDVIHFNVVWYD